MSHNDTVAVEIIGVVPGVQQDVRIARPNGALFVGIEVFSCTSRRTILLTYPSPSPVCRAMSACLWNRCGSSKTSRADPRTLGGEHVWRPAAINVPVRAAFDKNPESGRDDLGISAEIEPRYPGFVAKLPSDVPHIWDNNEWDRRSVGPAASPKVINSLGDCAGGRVHPVFCDKPVTGRRYAKIAMSRFAGLLHSNGRAGTAQHVGQQVDDLRDGLLFTGRLHVLTKLAYLNGLSR